MDIYSHLEALLPPNCTLAIKPRLGARGELGIGVWNCCTRSLPTMSLSQETRLLNSPWRVGFGSWSYLSSHTKPIAGVDPHRTTSPRAENHRPRLGDFGEVRYGISTIILYSRHPVAAKKTKPFFWPPWVGISSDGCFLKAPPPSSVSQQVLVSEH